jgi:cytochrome P450
MTPLAPRPGVVAGWHALQALVRGRSLLPPLAALHADLGDIFRLPFPNFSPVVLAGPRAGRFMLVDERHNFEWRMDADPVAHLLRHGVLVEDGAAHDALRTLLAPALHRRLMEQQAQAMVACLDEVAARWRPGQTIEVQPAMRQVALLVLTRCLFGVDIAPDLAELWEPILRTLDYIGPGAWLLWPGLPRLGYARALRQMDNYLHRVIVAARQAPEPRAGLIGLLVSHGLSDDLIRDQLLTLLIAGHDTAAATLTWALHALSRHPAVLARAQAEARAALGARPPTSADLGQLPYLDQVIKETLRLYPPIHVANRQAARDVSFDGRRIPAGARVLFSIFLTQRDARYWPDPERFDPERFNRAEPPAPFTYLPFGAGPRFCIGSALAQVETRMVLARLLQSRTVRLAPARPGLRMRATLEPSAPIRMMAEAA